MSEEKKVSLSDVRQALGKECPKCALSQKVVEAARFLCPPGHPGYETWGPGAKKLADALAEHDAAEGKP